MPAIEMWVLQGVLHVTWGWSPRTSSSLVAGPLGLDHCEVGDRAGQSTESPGSGQLRDARRIKRHFVGRGLRESFVPVSQGSLGLNKDMLLCLAAKILI